MNRRRLAAQLATGFSLFGSGCLNSPSDNGSDRSESLIHLFNYSGQEHDVSVRIESYSHPEPLIDTIVTLATDSRQNIYFTTDPEGDGTYPQIRATVSLVSDPLNRDSEARSFPPDSYASFSSSIDENGDVEVGIAQQ